MNKAQLISAIASKTKFSKKQTEIFVNAFIDTVKETLKDGDVVQLVGFGTFKVIDKKERKARNPKTKEIITVPAKRVPKFVPGKAFREIVK